MRPRFGYARETPFRQDNEIMRCVARIREEISYCAASLMTLSGNSSSRRSVEFFCLTSNFSSDNRALHNEEKRIFHIFYPKYMLYVYIYIYYIDKIYLCSRKEPVAKKIHENDVILIDVI